MHEAATLPAPTQRPGVKGSVGKRAEPSEGGGCGRSTRGCLMDRGTTPRPSAPWVLGQGSHRGTQGMPCRHHRQLTPTARPGERAFTLQAAGRFAYVLEVTLVPKPAWAGSSQGVARCDPPHVLTSQP